MIPGIKQEVVGDCRHPSSARIVSSLILMRHMVKAFVGNAFCAFLVEEDIAAEEPDA